MKRRESQGVSSVAEMGLYLFLCGGFADVLTLCEYETYLGYFY